jgi:hypothetical protein
MSQCDKIKSAKECQDARLANSTFGEGGPPIVITSATSSGGLGTRAAANIGGTVAALAGAALLFILLT